MTDWSTYQGLPFADRGRDEAGVDCWGLYRLILRRECGIDLPSFAGDYVSTLERAAISAIIDGEKQGATWRPVTTPRAFDLVLFRVGRTASHVACAVSRDRMLHVHAGHRSAIVPTGHPLWRQRLVGVYRHEALA